MATVSPDDDVHNRYWPKHIVDAINAITDANDRERISLKVEQNDDDDVPIPALAAGVGGDGDVNINGEPLLNPLLTLLDPSWTLGMVSGSTLICFLREYLQERVLRRDVPYNIALKDAKFVNAYKTIRVAATYTSVTLPFVAEYQGLRSEPNIHIKSLRTIHGLWSTAVDFLSITRHWLKKELVVPAQITAQLVTKDVAAPGPGVGLLDHLRPIQINPSVFYKGWKREERESAEEAQKAAETAISLKLHAAEMAASFEDQVRTLLKDAKTRSTVLAVVNALLLADQIYAGTNAQSTSWGGACSSFVVLKVQATSLVHTGEISNEEFEKFVTDCALIVGLGTFMARPLVAAVMLELLVERFCGRIEEDKYDEYDPVLQSDMLSHLKQVFEIFLFRSDMPIPDEEAAKSQMYQISRAAQLLDNTCGHAPCNKKLDITEDTRPQNVRRDRLDAHISANIVTFSADHPRTYGSAVNERLGLPKEWYRGASSSCPTDWNRSKNRRMSPHCLVVLLLWGTPKHRRCRNTREKATLQYMRVIRVHRIPNKLVEGITAKVLPFVVCLSRFLGSVLTA